MRTICLTSKGIAIFTLSLFCWSYLPLYQIAYAVTDQGKSGSAGSRILKPARDAKPEEKLGKLLEDIREEMGTAEKKTTKGENTAPEIALIKAHKAEIDTLGTDLRKDFTATEKKLKDTNLPKQILDRHYKFVQSYESSLAELKANLEAIEKAKTPSALKTEIAKTKKHLDKIKPPKKRKPFDPNKLPNRLVKGKKRAPRLKQDEFEQDFKTKNSARKTAYIRQRKLILVASNGPLTGQISDFSAPVPVALPVMDSSFSSGMNTTAIFLNSVRTDSIPLQIAQASTSVDPADLSETPEIQFSQAIKDLAAQLKYQPVNFYEWVRNNIEYAPTYGSIQGATMCLQAKQCNDIDTASLLIALFRASNIPAHYAYGTIEIPIEKVMNWVGGVTDPNTAATILATNGIPAKVVISGGTIKAIQLEHAWVEVYVPYGPYSGRLSNLNATKIWVPLDPSYKQYNYTQGIDIKTAVPFDAQTFANQILSTATTNTTDGSVTNVNSTLVQQTMQDYQTQVQNYIQQNYPNATVGDVIGKKKIKKQELGILPVTLPTYKVIQFGATFAQVPDNLRETISFNIPDQSGASNGLSYTTSLPAIAGEKITLSFSPATATDQAVIESYGSTSGLPSSLPAYLINLKPELRIDGQVVAGGASVMMGSAFSFTMALNEPGIGMSNIDNVIQAGEYYGIGLDTGRMGDLNALKTKLEATKAKLDVQNFTGLTKDDVIGDVLYATISSYFSELDVKDETSAKTAKVVRYRAPSVGMSSLALSVQDVFGVPLRASAGGMKMDVDRIMQAVFSTDGTMDKVKKYMLDSGINSSVLEHAIPERLYSQPSNPTSAISAAKALKIANDQAIPIYTVNQSNIANILPQLQIDSDVKNDIVNAVNTGKEVIVPAQNISLNNWTGCGYIILDPVTGAGAYMINGGLHGAWIILGLAAFTLLLFGGALIAGFIWAAASVAAAVIGAVLVGLAIGLVLSQLLSADSKAKLQELFTSILEETMEVLAAMGATIAMTVSLIAWIAMKIKEVIDEVAINYNGRRYYFTAIRPTFTEG